MNELQRQSYLDAMGVDSYVSRGQLPGAAVTRRLVVLRTSGPAAAPATAGAVPLDVSRPGSQIPGIESLPEFETPDRTPRQPAASLGRTRIPPVEVPRFSLAAIVAGDWLWLEDLAGAALARDQVWLIRAMAHALTVRAGSPVAQADPHVAQFDWPIHNNQQLDLGKEAARSALLGFIGRKLQEHGSRGVVLLGGAAGGWVDADALEMRLVRTASTLDMLRQPGLKRDVWSELQVLIKQ